MLLAATIVMHHHSHCGSWPPACRVARLPSKLSQSKQGHLAACVMLCGMSAVAGILGQELLGRSPEWYNVGATPQFMPQSALLAIEFFVLGHFEVKRYQGWNKYKTVSTSLLGCSLEHLRNNQCTASAPLAWGRTEQIDGGLWRPAVGCAGQLPLRPAGPEQRGDAAAGDQERPPRHGPRLAQIVLI
jgi:hypothetical protein